MTCKSGFMIYGGTLLLVLTLCFQSTICGASIEIAYDNDHPDFGWYDSPTGILIGIKFSPPDTIEGPIELQEICIYILKDPAPIEVLIYDENLKKIDKFTVYPNKRGWYTEKRRIGPIFGDFYVFLHWVSINKPIIGINGSPECVSHTCAASVDNPSKLISKAQLERRVGNALSSSWGGGGDFLAGTAGGSEEINTVNVESFGIMIRSSVDEDRNSVKGKKYLQLATEYFDNEKYKDAKYYFNRAKYYFNILHDDQKIEEIDSKIEICNNMLEKKSISSASPVQSPSTTPPGITSPSTTPPGITSPSTISPSKTKFSNFIIYVVLLIVVILSILITYYLTKKKFEKLENFSKSEIERLKNRLEEKYVEGKISREEYLKRKRELEE